MLPLYLGDLFQVLSISLAALGSLMWLRKNKPKTLIPIIYACAGIVATMPSITRCVTTALQDMFSRKRILWVMFVIWMVCVCSYLKLGLGWHFPKVVGFELFTSLVMAFISWQLFAACQRPSNWRVMIFTCSYRPSNWRVFIYETVSLHHF